MSGFTPYLAWYGLMLFLLPFLRNRFVIWMAAWLARCQNRSVNVPCSAWLSMLGSLHFTHHVHGTINGIINELTCVLYAGGQIAFFSQFNAREVWDQFINNHEINLFMTVATMHAKLIQAFDFRLSKRVPDFDWWCMDPWHCPSIPGHTLLERFGMTEIGMALSNPYQPIEKRVSGRVGGHYRVLKLWLYQILNLTLKGAVSCGHLRINGPTVVKEYFQRPDATRSQFD